MARIVIRDGRAYARARPGTAGRVHVLDGVTGEMVHDLPLISKTAAMCGELPLIGVDRWQWTTDPADCAACRHRLARKLRTPRTTPTGGRWRGHVLVGDRPVSELTLDQARREVRRLRGVIEDLQAELETARRSQW